VLWSRSSDLIQSVWSRTLIAKGVQHRVDFVTALFSLFLTFIAFYGAYKSSFWVDRFVFAAFGGILALAVVRYATLPPLAIFVAYLAKATIETLAGVVSLAALASGFRPSSNYPTSQVEGR